MYNFDGDFRRRPQQNLSGASKKSELNELIQRAQLERQKRQETKKQYDSAVLIQAYVRGYIIRQYHKRQQRKEFDDIVQSLKGIITDGNVLTILVRRLIFFYGEKEDSSRLGIILQIYLREYKQILLSTASNIANLTRLYCLLNITLHHIVAVVSVGSKDSLTNSMRLLEIFCSHKEALNTFNSEELATKYLINTFMYLIQRNYFANLRAVIDIKVPPLLEASPRPPTPLSAFLMDMIVRPLILVNSYKNCNFSTFALQSLTENFLAKHHSDAIHLFIVPALADLPAFPFEQLLKILREQESIVHSTWLLFSLLSLEGKHLMPNDQTQISNYIQLLASLTRNISRISNKSSNSNYDDGNDDSSDDDDVKMKLGQSNSEEHVVLQESIVMLNEQGRVNMLLLAAENLSDPVILHSFCQICHNLLMSDRMSIHKYKLLYMLAFKPSFLRFLWSAILSVCQTSLFGSPIPLLKVLSKGIPMTQLETSRIVPLLDVFCSLFSLLIATLHDSEFFMDDNCQNQTMPFSLNELEGLSLILKDVCLGLVELAFPDSRPNIGDDYRTAVHGLRSQNNASEDTKMWEHLFKVTVGLVRQFYTRDIRRPFCPNGHWISSQVTLPQYKPSHFGIQRRRLRNYRPFHGIRAFTREDLEEGPPLSTKEVRTLTILRELPFVVSFSERVLMFQSLILNNKTEYQRDSQINFLQGPYIHITVRRGYLYEDAFEKLSPENEPEMRLKMRVQLINRAGAEEAGVDGGGLFREFLSELIKTAFDPNRGFFRLTKENHLYPNPNVHLLFEDFPKHYYFIGRILGKALYENLLVELPLAEFFVSKLVGQHADVDVHHLASLDPIIYRNLLYLKNFEGDVADLGLDFTVVSDELGETRVEELKPGGSNIPVTALNRIEYIHLVADYKLNKQIRSQYNAFKQGLANVVPLEWLQMFNPKELQVLISGAQIPVDVEDLKQHTCYAGGYTADHPTIVAFWAVLSSFTDLQRSHLLKFVTSCSRPPLLGFKELDPPFCIQHAGTEDRLPTASTCMNLLKLPQFADEKTVREKLLYAIQSGAGFELS